MQTYRDRLSSPRAIGVGCAAAATALGLAYMAAAGAPLLYLAVNALALVMGFSAYALIRLNGRGLNLPGGVVIAFGAMLLTTALFGVSVEGAARWVRVGGVSLQISLVVLPTMLVSFAQRRDLLATTGIVAAAVALALQPDRAMAGVLVASLAVLVLFERDRWVVSALVAAAGGFAVAVIRPDTLPAVQYVDQILYTAFDVHPLAGLAVLGGTMLLAIPAVVGLSSDPGNRGGYAVFGAVWLSVVAAAALGNYPTPVVGYGGSAILGYALSLSFMPGRVRSAAGVAARSGGAPLDRNGPADLRVGGVYAG